MRLFWSSLFMFCFVNIFAQQNMLDEIVITDFVSKKFQKAQVKIELNDSILRDYTGNLTQLLEFKTPIFFKENGFGMVSSPSFRGTTAQQTAVLWNGIPINSFLLGQTDFNSLPLKSYDEIAVLPGGGGVLKGSGAIGGTIELNNNLYFGNKNEGEFNIGYGSFNTYNAGGRWQTHTKKWSFDVTFNRLDSKNNFKQFKKDWRNTNGEFYSNSIGANLGYRINNKNTISYHTSTFLDERHFSLVTPYQIPTKYQNSTFRNLLTWQHKTINFESNLRFALFSEQYNFFDQLPTSDFKQGKVNSIFSKWEAAYKINNKSKLASVISLTSNKGNGHDSGISTAQRTYIEASVLYANQITTKLHAEVGTKIDYSKDYETPFLYSAGILYQVNSNYELKFRTSKNYRIPTFNDLYWQPGGNLELKPEKSYQFEINQLFTNKKFSFTTNFYFNTISNLIQWIPTSSGYWSAQNTSEIEIFGAEFFGDYQFGFNNHLFKLSGMYAFIHAKNPSTDQYQIYVPMHKANFGLSYNIKRFTMQLDGLYTGEVYTRTNNDSSYNLKGYAVFNTSFYYNISNTYKVSFNLKNLTNQAYQTTIERWLPGRNYTIQLTIKI